MEKEKTQTEVYISRATTDYEWRGMTQDGYDALNSATDNQADYISTYEFFAMRTQGGAEWRAYAHKGLDIYYATVVDMRGVRR